MTDKRMVADIIDEQRESRRAELARLRAELEAANKHVEVVRSLREHDHQQIEALRAALSEAERERDEARKKLNKTQLENARLGLKLVNVLSSRESILCAARGMWTVLMNTIKDTPLSKSTVVQNVEQESYEALLRIVHCQQAERGQAGKE